MYEKEYLVTECNKDVVENCISALESKGKAVIICGDTGSGKTHLIHCLKNKTNKDTRYVTAEEFAKKMVDFIVKNQHDKLAGMLDSKDVLFLDDTAYLHGRSNTQSKIAKILNKALAAGGNVFITTENSHGISELISGLPAEAVEKLELTMDNELKKSIFKQVLRERKLDLPEDEIEKLLEGHTINQLMGIANKLHFLKNTADNESSI